MKKSQGLRGVFLANMLSYLLLVGVIFFSGIQSIETPFISYDYYAIQAESAASNGEVENATQRLEKAREVYSRSEIGFWFSRETVSKKSLYKDYLPWAELRVARKLMGRKQYHEAKRILEETLKLPGFQGESVEEIATLINR